MLAPSDMKLSNQGEIPFTPLEKASDEARGVYWEAEGGFFSRGKFSFSEKSIIGAILPIRKRGSLTGFTAPQR